MPDTTNAILLTAAMIRRRDDLKRLFSETYEIEVPVARAVIRGLRKDRNITSADAALLICKELDAAGMETGFVLAALVDELEEGE